MVMVMVFNATFNNISVILWRSVLLVEKTGEDNSPVRKPLTNSHLLFIERSFNYLYFFNK